MAFNRKMITVSENVVNIVNDALVLQHDFCDGKPIPAIVIDTSNNNKIENMLKLHMNVDEGEMKFSWGMTTDKKNIILLVESISPIELTFSILFEIEKNYAVIDEILRSQMLIIQGGKPDDRFSCNLNSYKIVVEVPLTGFEDKWHDLRKKYQRKRLKKMGVKNKDINNVMNDIDKEWDAVIRTHLK